MTGEKAQSSRKKYSMSSYRQLKSQSAQEFLNDWQQWDGLKNQVLAEPYGWLSLTSFTWLTDEEQTTIPRFPGLWKLHGTRVTYIPESGFEAVNRGRVLDGPISFDVPVEGDVSVENIDAVGLRAELIKVTGGPSLFAVRISDPQSAIRQSFSGVPHYPVDQRWVVPARFVPSTVSEVHSSADRRKFSLENRIGTLFVTIDNVEYALVVYQGHDDTTGRLKTDAEGRSSYQEIREGTEGQGLVFFRDQTSGKQTYGGGRCLVLDVREPDVLDYVDFNRAMNPTCAYNSYCTCPFAPLENTLPIAITAGELTPAVH